MFNLYLQLTMLIAGIIVSFYIFRNDLNIYYVMGLLVFVNAIYWIYLKEYKLIKYLQLNQSKFYNKYKESIGNARWRYNLRRELKSLDDDYIKNHTNIYQIPD